MSGVNRVADHFRAPEPNPESGTTVRRIGPVYVVAGLGCSCGCGVKALTIHLGDQVLLVPSAGLAAEIADAIRAAAAETWGGSD